MNTKAIIAGTLLTGLFTALVAGQSAFAGQDSDQSVYAELATNTTMTESVKNDKVRYDAPTFDNEDTVISGRK